jgi:hypothetical protein
MEDREVSPWGFTAGALTPPMPARGTEPRTPSKGVLDALETACETALWRLLRGRNDRIAAEETWTMPGEGFELSAAPYGNER